jgi:hypothetical protein
MAYNKINEPHFNLRPVQRQKGMAGKQQPAAVREPSEDTLGEKNKAQQNNPAGHLLKDGNGRSCSI